MRPTDAATSCTGVSESGEPLASTPKYLPSGWISAAAESVLAGGDGAACWATEPPDPAAPPEPEPDVADGAMPQRAEGDGDGEAESARCEAPADGAHDRGSLRGAMRMRPTTTSWNTPSTKARMKL